MDTIHRNRHTKDIEIEIDGMYYDKTFASEHLTGANCNPTLGLFEPTNSTFVYQGKHKSFTWKALANLDTIPLDKLAKILDDRAREVVAWTHETDFETFDYDFLAKES